MCGWIKLHRSLSGSEIARHPEYLAVWIHLLLKAQHSDYKAVVGRSTVTLKAGELLFGRVKFSLETGVSENKVRAALDVMKSLEMITIKSSAKYSIISITKWAEYQSLSPANNQETASNAPATHQQTATNKNVKNVNNEKNNSLSLIPAEQEPREKVKRASRLPDDWILTREYYDEAIRIDPSIHQRIGAVAEKFRDYWVGSGKTKVDWLATWRNWIRRDMEDGRGRGDARAPIMEQLLDRSWAEF